MASSARRRRDRLCRRSAMPMPASASRRDALAAIYHQGARRCRAFEPRWSTWAAGFGGSQTTDGNAALGSNNTTVEHLWHGGRRRLSLLAGYASQALRWPAAAPVSTSPIAAAATPTCSRPARSFAITMGAAYITGALAYGWQDITTDRTVTAAGIDQLRAEFNANAFSGPPRRRLSLCRAVGRRHRHHALCRRAVHDLRSAGLCRAGAVGSNTFALAYGAKDVTDTRSELGFRTDKSWAMTDGILTLRGRVAWAHDYDPNRSIGATFQTLPGASFVVNGAAQAADSALVTASVEKKWLNGWSAAATFEGEFSDVTALTPARAWCATPGELRLLLLAQMRSADRVGNV